MPTQEVQHQPKQADKAYERGLKLQRAGQFQAALHAFELALRLDEGNSRYVAARELVRAQLATQHIDRGNRLLAGGDNHQALAEFQAALQLDPGNNFAAQRLRDTLPAQLLPRHRDITTSAADSRPVVLRPQPGQHEFHLRGATRQIVEQVAQAFGIRAVFDESVTTRVIRFDLEPVDFFTAMNILAQQARIFWRPFSPNQIYVAADTPEQRRNFEEMNAVTFYIRDATSPQDLNEIVGILRTIFRMQMVTTSSSNYSVTVRAPRASVDAAAAVLESLSLGKPQVNLDVQVFEISESLARQIGLNLPYQFQVFNLPSSALQALQNPNIQNLINQLFAGGGINQLNTAAIAALLSQLQSQQNSLFQNPFATFGGGITHFAIPIPPATANFNVNESSSRNLENIILRAAQGNAANLHIGTRYPILNASFSPIFNTAAISQVLRNNSFIPPFPSFSYQDLGIVLKATPFVHGADSLTLNVDLQVTSLTAQSFNGVPVISERQYSGAISLKEGEPAVVVGYMTQQEQRSLQALPGIQHLPVFREILANHTRNDSYDEILVVITPHIVSAPRPAQSAEVWLGGGGQSAR